MPSDYFTHFGLSRKFFIDEKKLKQLYYSKSKELHPDFHTTKDEAHQEKMMELSSYTNKAYNVLKDFPKRVYYILQLEEMIKEEGENTLPQSFLMEMMDVNEKIMELDFDFDEDVYNNVKKEVKAMEKQSFIEIVPFLKNFDSGVKSQEILTQIRDFYFKQKYLWRIQENLDKFASR